ncbi:RBBP9/YdeN family alpha/beta hydrolase [Sphingomonas sp. ac-8]|uniref:RBBP9/YdeN family alpha/beta hydrolase n=1 Tax=Sphingomonas sp. ac-8 TaxID=3242977 RepID=UPI003A804B74
MASSSSNDAMVPTVLTVPGLNGSGPAHWQTLWEQTRPDTTRVDLCMWHTPHRNSWVTKLDQAIRRAQAPVVLVAHSLGCVAVAWWAALSPQLPDGPVIGALLVAPADVDRSDAPAEIKGFAPMPRLRLPFPSLVVASTDDPWMRHDRARSLAADWGSHFVDAGARGHLNADSGLGAWREGQELLDRVLLAGFDAAPRGDTRSLVAREARRWSGEAAAGRTA